MKTKNIIYLIVGAVLIIGAYMLYKDITIMKNSPGSESEVKSDPTIADIMSKNYTEEEARQILDAIKAGRISTY
jgi:hypothetical protein